MRDPDSALVGEVVSGAEELGLGNKKIQPGRITGSGDDLPMFGGTLMDKARPGSAYKLHEWVNSDASNRGRSCCRLILLALMAILAMASCPL